MMPRRVGEGGSVSSQLSAITAESGIPAGEAGSAAPASLRRLSDVRPLYLLPRDPFLEEVLIPAFEVADQVNCMVGFFSSAILASLAPGLATYLKRAEHKFRLIISPTLTPADQQAIEEGLKSIDAVVVELMEQVLMTVDELQKHTLRCFSHLLRRGQLEIRIAGAY
jgi:hypothetical protein